MSTLTQWRNCQVGVSVLHVDATNILLAQVFYRAEFRLTGGDLPTSCLLPWPQRSQGDIWRFQRKSQVRAWLLYMIYLCFLWILPFNEWTATMHDKIEMHESYSKLQAKKIQGWVRGAVGGSKQELLGKLLLYFVFHRHFSKSDQGHLQQQQHPRSLLSVVLPPVIICSFYS